MIAVIGDTHGCYFTLKELIKNIRQKYSSIEIYAVGDLVDRGNFSFEVVDFIIENKIKFVPGNHDYMFYYSIKEPSSVLAKAWEYNGCEKTIDSYEQHKDKIKSHLQIIYSLPLFLNLKDCFLSHAGISTYYQSILPKNYKENLDSLKKIACADITNEHGILWARDELVDLGKLQVVGHTRMKEVVVKKSNNTAYIDTSAYSGNKLSAVIIENGEVLDILSVATFEVDIK